MWAVLNFLVIVNNATVNICGDDFFLNDGLFAIFSVKALRVERRG